VTRPSRRESLLVRQLKSISCRKKCTSRWPASNSSMASVAKWMARSSPGDNISERTVGAECGVAKQKLVENEENKTVLGWISEDKE